MTLQRTLASNESGGGGSQRRYLVDWLAPTWVLLYLFVVFEPLHAFVLFPGSVPSLLLPASGVAVLAITPTQRLSRVPISMALLAVVLWSMLSYSWTNSPPDTLYSLRSEVMPLAVMTVVAGTIAPRTLVRLMLGFGLAVCAWSLLTSLTLPMSRSVLVEDIEEQQLGFRGSFRHKNILGVFAVLTLAVALPFLQVRWRRTILVLLAALALGTRSATAASGLLALAFVWGWMVAIGRGRTKRDRRLLLVLSLTSGVFAILSALRLTPVLLELYDKDVTFSGRTIIWSEAFTAIVRRPLQGWGLGGVWTEVPTPLTMQLWRQIGFEAAHTHNGAIELLLDLGLVGLGLMVLFLLEIFRRSARLGSDAATRGFGLWGTLTTTALLVMAIAEPLISGAFLAWLVLMWSALASVELEPTRRRRSTLATF